ncbi:MAG: NAD-dependent epimerase/dehydratase family protein [Nanoarchaeota archaeon]|nr:NAD-dependent epimerase/dehydratase family protein [Nanoarchaeota archaeon]
MAKTLVIGAFGQIGSELVPALRAKYGRENIIAVDIREPHPPEEMEPYEICDATDKGEIESLIVHNQVDTVYHLASLLSASGEKNPDNAWRLNVKSLKIVLDLAVKHKLKKVFWPSSIAAFGPTTPRVNTPQHTILEPTTMYGVTKVSGELLCQYYHHKYGLDVRSLRYPGLISYKAPPGGGTTDYAVGIFYDALQKGKYECFVRPDTILPMMYMDDAIEGTIKLMEAPVEKIAVRTSYNLAAISFSAAELAAEVKKHLPKFTCTYVPDARQKIADSWPQSVDDSQARKDWGWKHTYGVAEMTTIMIKELKKKLGIRK